MKKKKKPRTFKCRLNAFALTTLLTLSAVSGTQRSVAPQLRFKAVRIPSLVAHGASFWLSCEAEFESAAQFYSVKWYRNNNEFYNLVAAAAADATTTVGTARDAQKQQFFAQPELSQVQMSASNATHVKVLNTSLQAGGVFCCEISTQNLSTIRFEKEIKVFVPTSKSLQIVGLKAKYAVGDSLELTCLSDFSKPRAQLAWFLNGNRVRRDNEFGAELRERVELANSNNNNHYYIDSAANNYTNNNNNNSATSQQQPQRHLARVKLSIQMRLTRALLAQQQHAQQKSPPQKSAQIALQQSSPSTQRRVTASAVQLLAALQCKMRLVETSDVSFDELAFSEPSLNAASPLLNTEPAIDDDATDGDEAGRNELPDSDTPLVVLGRLSKTSDGKIVRRRNTVYDDDEDVGDDSYGNARSGGCRLGALALTDSDPLVTARLARVSPPTSRVAAAAHQAAPPTSPAVLSVECATLKSLVSSVAASHSKLRQQTMYCPEQRQLQPELHSSRALKQQHQSPLLMLSYVSLQQPAIVVAANQTAPPSEARLLKLTSLGSVFAEQLIAARALRPPHQQTALQPPTLLELFVNDELAGNSFAPQTQSIWKSKLDATTTTAANEATAVEISEEIGTATSGDGNESAKHQPTSTTTTPTTSGASGDASAQPAVDFAEHFANFDELYSPKQESAATKVSLRVPLIKQRFATPDSKLRVRCYSTRAQLLQADELTVALLLQSSPHEQQQQQQQLVGWQAANNAHRTKYNNAATADSQLQQQSSSAARVELRHSSAGIELLLYATVATLIVVSL